MNTFLQDILEAVDGEPIQAIVISGNRNGDLEEFESEVLSFDEAKTHLDYEYDSDYGSVECHAITAWTETKVLFITHHDGSTTVQYVPRHPVKHTPTMFGNS